MFRNVSALEIITNGTIVTAILTTNICAKKQPSARQPFKSYFFSLLTVQHFLLYESFCFLNPWENNKQIHFQSETITLYKS